jgi:hypothetical protein
MVGLRFVDMRLRPTEFLDFTSLTVEEFQMLIPPFEAAFQAHMAVWCLDGTARTARRFSIYQTCPLAKPEDRFRQRSRHGPCSIARGMGIGPRRGGLARWNALGAARQLFWNGVSAPPRVTAGSAVGPAASSSMSGVPAF